MFLQFDASEHEERGWIRRGHKTFEEVACFSALSSSSQCRGAIHEANLAGPAGLPEESQESAEGLALALCAHDAVLFHRIGRREQLGPRRPLQRGCPQLGSVRAMAQD